MLSEFSLVPELSAVFCVPSLFSLRLNVSVFAILQNDLYLINVSIFAILQNYLYLVNVSVLAILQNDLYLINIYITQI